MSEEQIRDLEKRIEELKSENRELRKGWDDINIILSRMMDILQSHDANIKYLKEQEWFDRIQIESLPFELSDPDYVSDIFKPQILSIDETINQIVEKGKSIGRFGDGEFSAIEGKKRWNFQDVSERLSEKLKEVLACDDEFFLIGLNPNFYGNLSHLSQSAADGVRAYMRPEVRAFHSSLLKKDKIYANTLLHTINTIQDVNNLKRIWDKRKITIIEGRYTRMGVGNDLLDNCESLNRIIAPEKNAIEKYDEIIKLVEGVPRENLILISLGPTATALAFDLYKLGYQAVDIGHIDLIYEKFLRGLVSLSELQIPYKYCTGDETGEERNIPDPPYQEYKQQIIASVVLE